MFLRLVTAGTGINGVRPSLTYHELNSSYRSNQRFDMQMRRKGQLCIVLTLLPRLCAFLTKGILDSRLNSNNNYSLSVVRVMWSSKFDLRLTLSLATYNKTYQVLQGVPRRLLVLVQVNTQQVLRHFKIRIIEAVLYIPAKHKELPPLQQHAVKETQREQQLLVFVLPVTATELLFCDQLVQALHVCLQTLWRHVTTKVKHQ